MAAFEHAGPSLPAPWPLVLVGPTGWGSSGLEWAPVGAESEPTLGPDGRAVGAVVPVGAVDAPVLAGLYAGARLLAYVPLFEGYGLPPLEAMHQGVPVVVSTTVPSVAPAVGEHRGAVGVDPYDVVAIADALVAAATDEPLRRSLSAAGRALADGRTWRHAARAHLALWERLA